ncbi:helix-turn-helix transcriptional regulator [Kitasatospora sp. NPDC096147]|uniref:helix-turn-helix transcriptional regulator n=1 Tax=Kitasatospora sp. NPDC096147 TaxID=3364093 RepID=UPI00381AC8E7
MSPPARNVHPVLARAAVRALRRSPGMGAGAGVGAAVGRAEELLAVGAPVPELLHAELLVALRRRGWPAVRAAAGHLLDRPRDPLVATLAASSGPAEFLARSRLLERWFHVGHTTAATYDRDGLGLTVRHLPHLGGPPSPAETLFVAAAYQVATGLVAGREPVLVLLAASGELTPSAACSNSTATLDGWRLRWAEAGPPAGTLPQLRARIALDPARAWRLPQAAAALGLSSRTLQRLLAAGGTTFRAELLAVRLESAAQLIRRSALPLADIAAAAGFTDHPHLTRRFGERYGCSPQAYRRAAPETAASPGPGVGPGVGSGAAE